MIDIEKAKIAFKNFLDEYEDKSDLGFELKIVHTYHVAENAKKIAEKLNLSKEDIELAELIGLLHDIGRFEELRITKELNSVKFNHAEHGSKMLFEKGMIRRFIDNSQYDSIIKKAIENHSRLEIEKDLDERTLLHSKIIRDADKIDIFQESLDFFWETDEEKMEVGTSIISENYIDQFVRKAPILRTPKQTSLDRLISLVAFIFDLNFDYSKKFVYEKDFINRMLDNFEFSQEKAKQQIEIVREVANNFLKESL